MTDKTIQDLQRENDILRAIIAKGPMDCIYCGLPAKDIAKCQSGFPGCGRGDDMMCDPRGDPLKKPIDCKEVSKCKNMKEAYSGFVR